MSKSILAIVADDINNAFTVDLLAWMEEDLLDWVKEDLQQGLISKDELKELETQLTRDELVLYSKRINALLESLRAVVSW